MTPRKRSTHLPTADTKNQGATHRSNTIQTRWAPYTRLTTSCGQQHEPKHTWPAVEAVTQQTLQYATMGQQQALAVPSRQHKATRLNIRSTHDHSKRSRHLPKADAKNQGATHCSNRIWTRWAQHIHLTTAVVNTGPNTCSCGGCTATDSPVGHHGNPSPGCPSRQHRVTQLSICSMMHDP